MLFCPILGDPFVSQNPREFCESHSLEQMYLNTDNNYNDDDDLLLLTSWWKLCQKNELQKNRI